LSKDCQSSRQSIDLKEYAFPANGRLKKNPLTRRIFFSRRAPFFWGGFGVHL
jgi:hypothetical protein